MFSANGKKQLCALLALAALGFTLPATNAAAEDNAVSASADVAFLSKYVWRGFELSKDSLVIQPSATVSYNGLAMNLWGNLDTDQYSDGDNNFNETDLTLSYDFNIQSVAMSVGYIYYGLDSMQDTAEVYVSASLDTLLSPSLSVYRDVDNLEGWYIQLGVSQSVPVTDSLSIDLAAHAGYLAADDADSYATADNDTFSNFLDGQVSVSMTIPVNDKVSVTPTVSYSFPLSSDASDLIEGASYEGDDSFVYGGVTASVAF